MDTPENKPLLALSESVEVKILTKPKRAASARLISSITPIKGGGVGKNVWKLFKALFVLNIVVLFTLFFSWIILISTVAATPSINDKVLFVDRNAWGLGAATDGSLAYVTSNSDYGILDKFMYHISGDISDGFIARIVARPLDNVATTIDGLLFVNGIATDYTSDNIIERKQLGNSYIISCLEGSCGIPGTLIEIPMEQAIGEVTGIITISGIKSYDQ
jgi:hypothetical protein